MPAINADSSMDQLIDNDVAMDSDNQVVDESTEQVQPSENELGREKRVRKLTQRMQERLAQQAENIVSYKASENIEDQHDYYFMQHEKELIDQIKLVDPMAYKASTNPNILYYHKAMKAPDHESFKRALIDEINAHIEGEH